MKQKKSNKKTLYFTNSMYNRTFIVNYCLKQLKIDYENMQVITCNKNDIIKVVYRFKDGINEKKTFIAKNCCSWSGIYSGFIINNNYYYYQLDDNCFFEGLFQRIKLDNDYNYIGKRYCYTEKDLFKNELLQSAIKVNYFNSFNVWNTYSNKTLLKYARIYYKDYFIKYFLNINDSCRTYEKRKVPNYYNNGYHTETVFDTKKYNIFSNH